MKRRGIITLAIILLFLLAWILTLFFPLILTNQHAEEFRDLELLGCNYMHPWDTEPQLRVLSYQKDYATVYYFSSTGGEKIRFVRTESNWTYDKTIAIWSSSGGSADDYFVWPYYRNWVP